MALFWRRVRKGALESFVSGPECAAVSFPYSAVVVLLVLCSLCMCVGGSVWVDVMGKAMSTL